MYRQKKALSILLAFIMVFSILITPVNADTDNVTVERIAGASRHDTAVKVSQATFVTSDYAIIASGDNYPDALVGGALATQISAPILTVSKDNISQDVLSELDRLGVKTIYLLGGTNTISTSVENTLKDKYQEVKRLAGKDRYETASEINIIRHELNRLVNGEDVKGGDKVTYVSGTAFADALSAAPFVGQINDGEPHFTMEAFLLAKPNEEVYAHRIFGGTSSVKGDAVFKRLAGINRYETAVEIAKLYPTELNKEIDTVVLVDGNNYPDALASAPYVAKNNAALLLTPSDKLSASTKAYIDSNNIKKVVVIGGENSVSTAVVNEIKGVTPNPEPEPKPEPEPTPEPVEKLYDVVRVIDGDTIIVNFEGKEERVRLIGVDTPESVHPDASKNTECGRIASNFTKERLEDKKVGLEFDVQQRDKYSRLLAYVYLDGVMFNKTLLEEGMAQISTYPPNTKYVDEFQVLATQAREANKGLWGMDCSVTPTPDPEPSPEPKPTDKAYLYANGRIIGNKNSKIYHLPHQKNYKDVNYGNAVFFDTEEEALAAKYRKAAR